MRRAILIFTLHALVWATPTASAQATPELGAIQQLGGANGEATGDEREEESGKDDGSMESLNARGFEAFERGEYVEAAAIFKLAYDIHGDANLLKNIAISHYAAADCGRARKTALLFLKEPGASPTDREEMTRLISRCDALSSGDAPPKEDDKLSPPPDDVAAPGTRGDGLRTLGGILAGVGIASMIGTGIYHGFAFEESEELKRISTFGGDAERYSELSTSVDTARVAVPALYATSAALMGGGLWLIVSSSPEGEATPQRAAVVRVGFSGRF